MIAALLCLAAAAEPVPLPSLAVFPLTARAGVAPDTGVFMTDALQEQMRASGRFSRVIGTSEIEQAITLDQKKQLIDCDSSSCFGEIAGALDVDLLLYGSVGKVDQVFAVSLKIIHARSSTNAAGITRTLPATSESVLLTSMSAFGEELLSQLLPAGAPVRSVVTPPPAPPPRRVPSPAPYASFRAVPLALAAAASGITAVTLGLLGVATVVGLGSAALITRADEQNSPAVGGVGAAVLTLGVAVLAGTVAALAWIPVPIADVALRVLGAELGALWSLGWVLAGALALVSALFFVVTAGAAPLALLIAFSQPEGSAINARFSAISFGSFTTSALLLPVTLGLGTVAAALGAVWIADRVRLRISAGSSSEED